MTLKSKTNRNYSAYDGSSSSEKGGKLSPKEWLLAFHYASNEIQIYIGYLTALLYQNEFMIILIDLLFPRFRLLFASYA